MEIVPADISTPVNISVVPVVGDHVWFVSDDELTDGMWIDGEVTEVRLNDFSLHVDFPGIGGEWTLKLNGKWKIPFHLSYVEFLEAQVEKLHLENREYRQKFGRLHPVSDEDYDFL